MPVDKQAAIEESFLLGLRLNRGVSLDELRDRFGPVAIEAYASTIEELIAGELLEQLDGRICLTARGRLLSNEVFSRFLGDGKPAL